MRHDGNTSPSNALPDCGDNFCFSVQCMSLLRTRFNTCHCSRTPSETILVQLLRWIIFPFTQAKKTSSGVAYLTSGNIFTENPCDLLRTINVRLNDYLSVHVELGNFKVIEVLLLFFNYALQPFKAYCATWVRRSNFRYQASPRVTTRGHPKAEGGTVGEKCPVILPKFRFHITFRNLLHAVKLRHGTDGFTSPPKEGALRIFSP
jgi:hypothetical protein